MEHYTLMWILKEVPSLLVITAFFFLLMGIILGQYISDGYMEKPHTEKTRDEQFTHITVSAPDDKSCSVSRSFMSGTIGAITVLVLMGKKRRK